RIMAAPYKDSYQAAGTIVKALERKQMNFPGNLEDHLKKAHAAVHGREMWDDRYSEICDLLKQARKLLHDIEREAEAAEGQQQGQEVKQVVGKADPTDVAPIKKIGTGTYGVGRREQATGRPPKPNTFLGKPVDPSIPSSRTGTRPAGWGTPADQRRANQPKNKAVRKAEQPPEYYSGSQPGSRTNPRRAAPPYPGFGAASQARDRAIAPVSERLLKPQGRAYKAVRKAAKAAAGR
ncbi:hypothetical protein LCGC14_2815150, partial [marine sediment metagenome]